MGSKKSNHISTINAVSAGAQVLIVNMSFFLSYKIILNELGSSYLGVWTLLLSVSSFVGLANFGIGPLVLKIIAEAKINNLNSNVEKIIGTSGFITLSFSVIVAGAFYILYPILLKNVLDSNSLLLAKSLLPYIAISLVITAHVNLLGSFLDALQLTYKKNILLCMSSIMYILLTYVFIKEFGLLGAAYAWILQGLINYMLSIILLKSEIPYALRAFFKFNNPLFWEMIKQGSKMQIISIAGIFLEPVTKFFISKYLGVAVVGFYEIASRIVSVVKIIISNATQVIVPRFSIYRINGDVKNEVSLFTNTFNNVFFLSTISIVALIGCSRILAYIFIGENNIFFTQTIILLSCAWYVNLLAVPSYYTYIALGNVNTILVSHIVMSFLNLILCYCIGGFFQSQMLIGGWALAIIISSLIILVHFYTNYKYLFAFINIPSKFYFLLKVFSMNSLIYIITGLYDFNNLHKIYLFLIMYFMVSVIVYLKEIKSFYLTYFTNETIS